MYIPTSAQSMFFEATIDGLHKRQGNKSEPSVRKDTVKHLHPSMRSWEESGLLHHELEIAKKVQKASFPQHPAIPGLKCASFYKPAHSIGGDYYDFLMLEDGRWGIAVGDVSGKGIGAALVMANLQASLRAQVLRPRSKIETLMKNINRLLQESSPAEFFASLFYAEYQPDFRLLTYVNAGHNPPLVVRRTRGRCDVYMLYSGGAPVGALETSRYMPATFQLEAGDVLVAYTDGITESEGLEGEPFGQDRLEEVLCSCSFQDPRDVLRTILDEVFAHSTGDSHPDDMTLLVIQVEGVQCGFDSGVQVPGTGVCAGQELPG